MAPSDPPEQRSQYGRDEKSSQASERKPDIPPQILRHANNAAATATSGNYCAISDPDTEPPIEDVPPPPYSAGQYGEIDIDEKGMSTGARVAEDGRVEIKISSKNRRLTSLLKHQLDASQQDEPAPEPEIPEGLGYVSGLPPPPMNVVIHIVGSRGDVQPFIALGLVLKNKFNHRVRIATHPVFRDFVTENGLEFFSIGGDPAELMAFMVKNPGLMPGIETLRSGDIGKRRRGVHEMIHGCWRSCIEPGDGTGVAASDDMLDGRSTDRGVSIDDPTQRPFVADAIIANPPSFAHIHVAEKLGVPLHLMFTMPWSPTQSFPHPLANIVSSNADAGMTNFLSYILVDLLTWQGTGDIINRFREKTLQLEPLSIIWAPGNLHRLRVPWTYCWSPALIPKPDDWKTNIDVSGFYFLNLATNYTPDPDLAEFLSAGPPPVYIGFGSIVVDDPNAMTKLIFEAVKKTGQRALVSKGWGGLSGDEMGVPEGVFMLGNCPHDWLFQKVSCVVHHGGAGTTAAGIAAGRPTIIVPFFGDQQFWGQMCHRAGAGPDPIPHKTLTADNLAEAINYALKPEVLDRAREMSNKIKQEEGSEAGAESFHRHLSIPRMRCSICPGRVAVWQYRKSGIRLSALAATVLANEGLIEFSDLRLHRVKEYVPDTGPPEPISGGAAALIGTIGSLSAGVADYPAEILKSFKKASNKSGEDDAATPGPSSSTSTLARESASTLPSASERVGQRQNSDSSMTSPKVTASHTNIVGTDVEDESGAVQHRDSEPAPPTPSLSSTSLRPGEDPRHSRSSLSPSGQKSPSKPPTREEKSPSGSRAQQITMDSMLGSARATGNIVVAGMKSPLDFTMSLAQGFHNAPKLYGDKTVRPAERVTGFHSGLRAAGREFGFGFYDGISGLVTQPLQGAKEEGMAGFGKGLLKGSFGLFFKPGAAVWGIPGYTMKGIYAEIVKNFGKSTANFIVAARTTQGYDDLRNSGEGERERIMTIWKSDSMQSRATSNTSKWWGNKQKTPADKKARFYGDDGQLLKGWMATKHLSYDDRKELERLRNEAKQKPSSKGKSTLPNTADDEFEEAIRTAVQRTSTNDAEEDARIERAIRASVREIRQNTNNESRQQEVSEKFNAAYERAIAASVAEYQRPVNSTSDSEVGVVTTTLGSREDDEEFTRALQASLEESRRAQHQSGDGVTTTDDDEDYRKAIEASKSATTAGHQPEDDEDYKRAIEESKQAHYHRAPSYQGASSSMPAEAPPQYESLTHSGGPTSNVPAGLADSKTSFANAPPLPARDPQKPAALASSIGQNVPSTTHDANDDEDFQRTLKASEQEAKQREVESEKQRTEEDVVLEYVKRQSLAEEEYRRRMQGGA